MASAKSKCIVIVPAFNEEASIGGLVRQIRIAVPDMDVLVINDGSADRTGAVAAEAGAIVLDLPCNLGVGGAVQTGFYYAYEQGYEFAVRCDGDGQHSVDDIPKILARIRQGDVDLVVGSRFLSVESYTSSLLRHCGITVLAALLTAICRRKVTDPTSGFMGLSRPMLYFFSRKYPLDYPEPEALALMRRHGYDFAEMPAVFKSRQHGTSSIGSWDTLYYAFKVFLALLVDRARMADERYSKAYLKGKI